MKRLVTCFCILMFVLSCELDQKARPPANSLKEADSITIFMTGSILSELKPCGCSGGQLGGLEKRAAILDYVPRQRRLIIDTGSFLNGESEQDMIKFNIIIRALDLLGYDLISLTKKDIELAANRGLLDSFSSLFNTISAQQTVDANMPRKFTKQLPLNGKDVTVTVVAFDAESEPIEQIDGLFARGSGEPGVNILILNSCNPAVIDSITGTANSVDCVVCPGDSDQPRIISKPIPDQVGGRPLVFSVGRFGRYVCKLQVTEVARSQGKLALDFQAVPVAENLPQNSDLVQLYKAYQEIVKESRLLERYPRFSLPDGLKYVGSESCGGVGCHQYEYLECSDDPHVQAYQTLVQVGSQYDPECVICHVVGMRYESGFVSEEKTPYLKGAGVGCEVCHGPGSEHCRTQGLLKTTEPKSTCLDCHTPERSAEYAGHEALYLEKINHW